jgi:hypothetical protein
MRPIGTAVGGRYALSVSTRMAAARLFFLAGRDFDSARE